MGVGFAIPCEMAESVMRKLIDHGHVERGYLGAMIQDLDGDLASSFGYEGSRGVLIGDVLADGPAAKAGLETGDIVIEFNGRRVDDANELRHAVAATNPGTDAKMRIFRDGKERTLRVEIGKLESSMVLAGREGSAKSDLGMSVQTLTPDAARQYGFDTDDKGVLVTEVEPGSAAASVGVRPGDLIVAVGGKPVKDVTDFRSVLRGEDLEKGVRMRVMRDGVRRFVFVKART
jgi:serine protease Do